MKCKHGFKYKDECARCLGLKKTKEVKGTCETVRGTSLDLVGEFILNEGRVLSQWGKKGFYQHHSDQDPNDDDDS